MLRLCLINSEPLATAKFFIRSHLLHLPFEIIPVEGLVPSWNGKPIWKQDVLSRAARKGLRTVTGREWSWEYTGAMLQLFRSQRPDVVLAEWGPNAARVREACVRAGVPLVAHFHGYDASERDLLDQLRDAYRQLFTDAAAVVAVSKHMRDALIGLGAPAAKVHVNPYGVDCDRFAGARPGEAPPRFVAVGRFVDKKAPHLTILAFQQVHAACPEARLIMIGDGPLLGACRDLVEGLRLSDAVEFRGWQDADGIHRELIGARCFVQHSLTAQNGDCEGLPNTVLEAAACGLPIVATRHAGIPDAITEDRTGFLVDERDIDAMAAKMSRLAQSAELAAAMGTAARQEAETRFSLESSISGLAEIIRGASRQTDGASAS